MSAAWYQFQGDDRRRDVTAETVGCRKNGNALGSVFFRPKKGVHTNHSPTREIRGRVGLWVLNAHARVFHYLHCICYFSPYFGLWDFFFPAVSGPHLNAPSEVSEANELPATTASGITVVPLHLENPLLIVKHLMSHTALQRKGAESRPAGQRAPWGAGEAVSSSDQNGRGMELFCQFVLNGSPQIWADYWAGLLQALHYTVHGNLGGTLCYQDQVLSSADWEFRLILHKD